MLQTLTAGKAVWLVITVYIIAAVLALGFWGVVIWFGIKLAKKAWGS